MYLGRIAGACITEILENTKKHKILKAIRSKGDIRKTREEHIRKIDSNRYEHLAWQKGIQIFKFELWRENDEFDRFTREAFDLLGTSLSAKPNKRRMSEVNKTSPQNNKKPESSVLQDLRDLQGCRSRPSEPSISVDI